MVQRSDFSVAEKNLISGLVGYIVGHNQNQIGHLMRRTDPLKRPQCWERLKVGGEGENRGRDGWMTSLTERT